MNVLGVIPARYESSRFPGKPLADIFGKPMIWWVYQTVKKIETLSDVVVATDDERIKDCCDSLGLKAIITGNHQTHVARVHEISEKIKADYYLVVCGDEPLLTKEQIEKALPVKDDMNEELYVGGACRFFSDPAEVIDPANIKIVTNEKNECILLSRAAVPFPYKTVLFKYKKVVGIECYNKKALDFFVKTPKGRLESIEDVTLQRFLENKIHIKYRLIEGDSLSVDTPKDLEKVIEILRGKSK